jgi:hypothetical protein
MASPRTKRTRAYTTFRHNLSPDACMAWQKTMYGVAWQEHVLQELAALPRDAGAPAPTLGQVAAESESSDAATLVATAWLVDPLRIATVDGTTESPQSTERNRLAVAVVLDLMTAELLEMVDGPAAQPHKKLREMATTFLPVDHSRIKMIDLDGLAAARLAKEWPGAWELLKAQTWQRYARRDVDDAQRFQDEFARAWSTAGFAAAATTFLPSAAVLSNLFSALPMTPASRERVNAVVGSFLARHAGDPLSPETGLRLLLHYPAPPDDDRTKDIASGGDVDHLRVFETALDWIAELERSLLRHFPTASAAAGISRHMMELDHADVLAGPSKNDPVPHAPAYAPWSDDVGGPSFDAAIGMLAAGDPTGAEAIAVLRLAQLGEAPPPGTRDSALRLALAAVVQVLKQIDPRPSDEGDS